MKNEESVELLPPEPAMLMAEPVAEKVSIPNLLNAFVSDDGSEEWRQTQLCLAYLFTEVMKQKIPHVLSADSLESNVIRCDCLGPVYLGFFYPRQLHYECRLLIPRMLSVTDLPGWQRLIFTWNQNERFFRCVTIGPVLQIYVMELEKWWKQNA